jgi:hypothetical protein
MLSWTWMLLLAKSSKAPLASEKSPTTRISALLSSRLENSDGRAENLLHLIFIARSLERIGDLAVNIGEDSVFLSEARDIRHDRKASGPGGNPA